jgi:hypothetical protein
VESAEWVGLVFLRSEGQLVGIQGYPATPRTLVCTFGKNEMWDPIGADPESRQCWVRGRKRVADNVAFGAPLVPRQASRSRLDGVLPVSSSS